MIKTFTWSPVRGMTTSSEPRVKKAQFGDGYSQRAPDGLNPDLKTFSPTFRYPDADITDIADFLEEHGGYLPFYFTPSSKPGPVLVTCTSWSQKRISATRSELTCKFEQVPA